MKKTETVVIRISKEDKDKIKSLSKELGLSVSSYILMNIKNILKDGK